MSGLNLINHSEKSLSILKINVILNEGRNSIELIVTDHNFFSSLKYARIPKYSFLFLAKRIIPLLEMKSLLNYSALYFLSVFYLEKTASISVPEIWNLTSSTSASVVIELIVQE